MVVLDPQFRIQIFDKSTGELIRKINTRTGQVPVVPILVDSTTGDFICGIHDHYIGSHCHTSPYLQCYSRDWVLKENVLDYRLGSSGMITVSPGGIAMAKDGKLLITSHSWKYTDLNFIVVIQPRPSGGDEIMKIRVEPPFSQYNQLDYPKTVAIHPNGSIYVADCTQIFVFVNFEW